MTTTYLDSLARYMGYWHTGMSHSIQEDLRVLGYLRFQDDRGGQEDLWNLWTLVGPFWILLVDLVWVKTNISPLVKYIS